MLPIDYLRRLQGGDGGPSVGVGASSTGPLAEILTRALPDAGIQFGGGVRRALPNPPGLRRALPEIGVQTPDGGMRRVFAPSGNPYLDERLQPGASAGWTDPGGEIPLPDGGAITMPEGGLSQAEIDVLSGIRAGTQVAPGNEAIVQSLMERGVLAAPGPGPGPGTGAMLAYGRGNATPGAGARGDFMSALRGGEAPIRSDVMPKERAVPGGGQVTAPPQRATPAPTPPTQRVGAPRPPTPPRRATPQPAPGGAVQGPRPVLTARPLPLADPRRATAIPYRNDINGRRGVDKQLMPPRRAGQTDRLMGNR